MVDLVITPASVVKGGNAQVENGTSGATITAGQTVYKEAATGLFKLADSNSATLEARPTYGIALHAASANQPLAVHVAGDITIGATVVAGTPYYQSESAGGIQPHADLSATELVTLIGFATTTTNIAVRIQYTGVVL